jgi:hypothetical protein
MDGDTESKGEGRKKKVIGKINGIFQNSRATSEDFPLKNSYILDSGSSIHVSHDLKRFESFRHALTGNKAVCGSGTVTIQGYGDVDITLLTKKGQTRILRLHNVAYYPNFSINLVLLRFLEG